MTFLSWRTEIGSVDILTHMNELNAKLQWKELFAHHMYTSVMAFKSKLALFSAQMSNNSFVNFSTLLTMKEASNTRINTANH